MGLKMKDIKGMSAEARKGKIQELKLEMIRGRTSASKTKSKTKDIKRAIARLLTFAQAEKLGLGRKK